MHPLRYRDMHALYGNLGPFRIVNSVYKLVVGTV